LLLRHLSRERENPVRPQHHDASSLHLVGRAGLRQDLRPIRSGQAFGDREIPARSRWLVGSPWGRLAGRRRITCTSRAPMEFDNALQVPLPPDQAWPVLMNVQGIAPCMPGAQLTEVVDDKSYKGNIAV